MFITCKDPSTVDVGCLLGLQPDIVDWEINAESFHFTMCMINH